MSYLNKMTVRELREVGKRMELVSPLYKMRKDELVKLISGMVDECHSDALLINEAVTASQNFIAEERQRKIESGEIYFIDGIEFGGGWKCCKENPAKVMTFDDGAKWAVCKSCASSMASRYISDLPEQPPVKVEAVYVLRDENGLTVTTFYGLNAEIMIEHDKAVRRFNPELKRDKKGWLILTPKQARRIRKNGLRFAKKKGLFND